MSAQPAPPPRPHRRRRLRRTLVVLVVLAAGLTAVVLLAPVLFGPLVGRVVTGQLEDRLGGEWALGGVQRLGLGGITLADLRQTAPGDAGAVRAFEAEVVAVSWSPLALLGDPLGALRGLRCTGLELELAADRPLVLPGDDGAEPEAADPDETASGGDPLAALDPDCRLDLAGSARVTWGGHELLVEQLVLHGRIGEATLTIAPWSLNGTDLEPLHARWTGLDPATGGDLVASLPVLGEVTASARREDAAQPWRLQLDGRGGDGRWQARLGAAGWSASIEELDLEPSFAALERGGTVLPDTLTATPRLWLEAAGRGTRAEAELRLLAGVSDPRPGLTLRLAGAWVAGLLELDSLHLHTDAGQLTVTGLGWSPATGITRLDGASAEGWRLTALDPLDPPELSADLALVEERLELELDVAGGGTRLDLAATAGPGIAGAAWAETPFEARWHLVHALPLPRRGELSASGQAGGTPGAPRATLELRGEDLQWSDLPTSAVELDAELRPGEAVVERCLLRSGEQRFALDEPARLSWSAQGWRLHPLTIGPHRLAAAGTAEGLTSAELHLAPIELASLGLLAPAVAGFTGSVSAELAVADGATLEGRLGISGLGPEDPAVPRLDAELTLSGDDAGLAATAVVARSGGDRLLGAELALDRPFAARWDWAADLAAAPLSGRAELDRLPLEGLAPLLPGLVFARGVVAGEARLAGTLGAPEPSGRLRFEQVDLGTGTLPPITGLTGAIGLDPDYATIEGLRCQLGYAPLRVAGRFALGAAEHDLELGGQRVLLVENRDLRVRADLDCHLGGPRDAPRLAGRIGITEFLYTADTGWTDLRGGATGAGDQATQLFSIEAEPWSRMTFDLRIHDGGLEAEDPGGLDVRMPLFQGTMLIDLELGGTGRVPEPVGTVSTSDATAVLPFTSYTVESAQVRFRRENPFEPLIDATLTTRMAGYDVRLVLEGPVSDPRLSVTTSPPLPSDDALLLATTGLTPAETADGGSAALGTALAFLAKELTRKLLGPGDPDAEPGFWSRFDFSLDEERSESGLSTARAEFELTRRWYLFAERDRFEDYNGGILYRFSFGAEDPAPEAEAEDGEALADEAAVEAATAIAWEVRPATPDTDLPLSTGHLRDLVRRHRRAFERSGGDPIHAADAAATMARALRDEGHPEAVVTLAFEPDEDAPETIVFVVEPGRHWVWGEVTVDGAPPDHRERILAIATSHLEAGSDYLPGDLDAARSQIARHLELDGHAEARVEIPEPRLDPASGRVVAAIRVMPGPRHEFAGPTLTGGLDLDQTVEAQIRELLEELAGRPWLPRTAVMTRAAIEGLLQDQGYQWAEVELIMPGDERSTVDPDALPPRIPVGFHLEPGPVVHLGEIVLRGFDHTAPGYVRHRLGLEPGEPLAESELDEGLSRLRRTVPLRRLKAQLEPASATAEDEAVLVVEAEEAPHQHVEIEAGYGSYVGPFAGARYRNENLLGYGRQWTIGGEGSAKHRATELTITDRDLLGGDRQLSLLGEFYLREQPSFTDTHAVIEPSALFPLTERQRLRLAYSLEWSKAEDVEGGIPGAEVDGFLRTARLDAEWRLSTFADPWLPTSGWVVELGSAVADEAIGSELDFVEVRAGTGVVIPLAGGGEAVSLALNLNGTTRQPTDDRDTLPIQERLFLGGANSVRSFDTELLAPTDAEGDAVGGLTAAYAQAELRVRLVGRLYAAAFYDVGMVDPEAWEANDTLGHAVGAGLRLNLPIGPLRFDAGYNPGDETFAQDDRWAFHFAVGYTF